MYTHTEPSTLAGTKPIESVSNTTHNEFTSRVMDQDFTWTCTKQQQSAVRRPLPQSTHHNAC